MKPKTILFSVIALFLLTGGTGCEKEKEEQAPAELYGTWKLAGFGNTADNTFREAEPEECEKCYTMTFLKDGTITGHASTNEIEGKYEIKSNQLHFPLLGIKTYINELWDGPIFLETVRKVNRFELNHYGLEIHSG